MNNNCVRIIDNCLLLFTTCLNTGKYAKIVLQSKNPGCAKCTVFHNIENFKMCTF